MKLSKITHRWPRWLKGPVNRFAGRLRRKGRIGRRERAMYGRIRAAREEYEAAHAKGHTESNGTAQSQVPLGKRDLPARSLRVLFNSQFSWSWGTVDYALAAALRLRGHDVRMVACGGLPEYCELQTRLQERPDCRNCLARLAHRFDAFGLPYVVMRNYLTDFELAEATRVACEQRVPDLLALRVSDVPVGKLAHYNLFQYFRATPYRIEGKFEAVFRRCVASAILVARAAQRIIDEYRPDVLVSVNGKFLQWAPFIAAAAQRGIRYVTWEDFRANPPGAIFACGDIAHNTPLDGAWEEELKKPFPESARQQVREFFSGWTQGKLTPWGFYDENSVHDPGAVRGTLGIGPDAPIVSLFPNLGWDGTSVALETAFDSMYDWLLATIEYARRRPDVQFVVRAHPHEVKLPEQFRSETYVCAFLRQEVADLPRNVHLLEGDHPLSSYALAEASAVVMTYTSTLGVELPLRGIRPWVAAGAYYANKGFTLDLKSRGHMCELLDANHFDNRLSEREIELAERLVHMARLRKVFTFPHLDDDGRYTPPHFGVFAPGGDAVIDDLCRRIEQGPDYFLDVGQPTGSPSTCAPLAPPVHASCQLSALSRQPQPSG